MFFKLTSSETKTILPADYACVPFSYRYFHVSLILTHNKDYEDNARLSDEMSENKIFKKKSHPLPSNLRH